MNAACIICSENLCTGSEVYATPCGHIFHHDCLLQWLQQGSKTCPQCRARTTKKTIQKIFFAPSATSDGDGVNDVVASLLREIEALKSRLLSKKKIIENYRKMCFDRFEANFRAERVLTSQFAELQERLRALRIERMGEVVRDNFNALTSGAQYGRGSGSSAILGISRRGIHRRGGRRHRRHRRRGAEIAAPSPQSEAPEIATLNVSDD